MTDYVKIRAEFIETLEEARTYYRARLVGTHKINCYGKPVTVVFERDAIHLFSVETPGDDPPPVEMIARRRVAPERFEERTFSLKRARLMDEVLRAVSLFTVSIPGTGAKGREKRMLHGPRLTSGEYLRVVLRPGPGEAFTCVSAYPINADGWRAARAAKRAKFPP